MIRIFNPSGLHISLLRKPPTRVGGYSYYASSRLSEAAEKLRVFNGLRVFNADGVLDSEFASTFRHIIRMFFHACVTRYKLEEHLSEQEAN